MTLELIRSFIAEVDRVQEPLQLCATLHDAGREMGFDYVAIIQHNDLSRYTPSLAHMTQYGLLAASTYPEAISTEYIADNMVARDPVLLASHRMSLPFYWDEVPKIIHYTDAHRDVREWTEHRGIGAGLTVPLVMGGEARGSCNFAMGVGRDPPENMREIAHIIGLYAFNAARTMVIRNCGALQPSLPKLSQRQLECLLWFGQGKRTPEIATILEIERGTVRRHLENARELFGVSTCEQVLMLAIHDGQISTMDLVPRQWSMCQLAQ